MAEFLAAIAIGAVGLFGPGCQRNSDAAAVVEANINVQATTAVPAPAVAAPVANNDAEVLTQGPIHEAFAEPTSAELAPGQVVPKEPPAAIEEVPPDERPDGNPIWIPGYWAWDDDRADFIWISGIWRIPPPDCDWVPGYWSAVQGGWSWTPGFWMTDRTEVNYLPAPPESLEIGPSSPAPSDNYVWTPGCWMWIDGRYVWRPGYWLEARPDWVWVPPTYVYTSSGCIYVDGYWDYALEDRGVIFAPTYFRRPVYVAPTYVYTPSIVIEVNYITTCLFVSPHHRHYYFGDYYGDHYFRRGYVPWFDYGRHHRHGYDPIYTHERWRHHRDNPRWEAELREQHHYRESHQDARPPRVYRRGDHERADYRIAAPLNEFSKRKEGRLRFEKINDEQRKSIGDRGRDMRKFRDERARVEAGRDKRTDAKTALVVPNEIRQIRHSNGDMPKRPDEGRNVRGRNADVRDRAIERGGEAVDRRAPRGDQRRGDVVRTPDIDRTETTDKRDIRDAQKNEKRIDQADRRDARRSRMPVTTTDTNRNERDNREQLDIRARDRRTETQDLNKRDESANERIDIKPMRSPKPVGDLESGRTVRGRDRDSGKSSDVPDFKPTRNSKAEKERRDEAAKSIDTGRTSRSSDRSSTVRSGSRNDSPGISDRGLSSRRDDTPRVSTDRSASDRGVNPPRSESRRDDTPRVSSDRGSSDRGSSSRSEAPKVESRPQQRDDSSSKHSDSSRSSSSSSSSSSSDKKDRDDDRGSSRGRR
ncbi:hypothetical protein LLG95_16920 [bacterium]|nr:hypothetical protein [bacterium]